MTQNAESGTTPLPEALRPVAESTPESLVVRGVRLGPGDPTPPSAALVPLRDAVLFPGMITPYVVVRPQSVAAIKRAATVGSALVFVAQRNADLPEPDRDDLHDVGTLGRLLRVLRFSDGSMRVLVEGIRRVRIGAVAAEQPVLRARLVPMADVSNTTARADALTRALAEEFQQFSRSGGKGPPELEAFVQQLQDLGRICDYVAGNLPLKAAEQEAILEEPDVERRAAAVRAFLQREKEMGELQASIHNNVQTAMDKSQREYYLREQLRAVREELGEIDPSIGEIEHLRKRVKEAKFPKEVEDEANRELDRMDRMHRDTAEFTVSRTYLDWLLDLPWNEVTEDRIDLDVVETVLTEDHTGLAKVKERIVEYLSVRRLNPASKGPILCFVGPPGVGKTSLGRSIARAMGRKFQRISLGGVKDESEIRGHRRTYIGSMPGRIVQAVKRAGSRNPVMVLDEIDKVGNDFRGDPASALLEALDPEQNKEFVDHYIDVPFDLSQVMFICTANVGETIPHALLDRMEVIEIPGYTEEEKQVIAKDHLIPRIRREAGLPEGKAKLADDVVKELIRGWTAEAGVRGLERELAKIARKLATRVVREKKLPARLSREDLADLLGPKRYFVDMAERIDRPGIAVGLAWTPVGGDILFIESTVMPGERKFRVTGQLGDVMKESAETALSWIRSSAARLGIDPSVFKESDIHVHLPQGAIPKDGPSAGVAMVSSLVSLLSGRKTRHELAMTGEITLRGKVLPVGGIKEKVLAARRAGIQKVLLPRQNEKDLLDIPKELREQLEYVFLDSVDDLWPHVFGPGFPPEPVALVSPPAEVGELPTPTPV